MAPVFRQVIIPGPAAGTYATGATPLLHSGGRIWRTFEYWANPKRYCSTAIAELSCMNRSLASCTACCSPGCPDLPATLLLLPVHALLSFGLASAAGGRRTFKQW